MSLYGCCIDGMIGQPICSRGCGSYGSSPFSFDEVMLSYKGSAISVVLSAQDLSIAAYNAQEAMSNGGYMHPYVWKSCDSGIEGTFTLLRSQTAEKKHCIQYEESISMPSVIFTAQGDACRDRSGLWRIITQSPAKILYRNFD